MSLFIEGIKDVTDQYDAFIIDLWGVIHDGINPYPAAIDALKNLKALNKTTLLLSNSPRRVFASEAHLTNMGLPRNLYTHIYTSGEDTHRGLKDRPDSWHQKLGHRFYHIGPDFHQPMYTDLPYEKVSHPQEADFILMTGAIYPHLEAYEPILKEGLHRHLPMLCANPDRVVVESGALTLCCGSIAEWYETMGGDVFYHGKPYTAIYHEVFSILKDVPQNRMLAIGDSLTTDVKGAVTHNMHSVLIMGGIHQEALLCEKRITDDTPHLLKQLSNNMGFEPNYALIEMKW